MRGTLIHALGFVRFMMLMQFFHALLFFGGRNLFSGRRSFKKKISPYVNNITSMQIFYVSQYILKIIMLTERCIHIYHIYLLLISPIF